MGMTTTQAFVTVLAVIAAAVFLAAGGYYCVLHWIDRAATKRARNTAQTRWENCQLFARWDQDVFDADYGDALRAEMKREYRHIPDSVDARVQR